MNSADITIRKASLSDLDGIYELSHQLGYPANKDNLAIRLEELGKKSDHIILVAEDSSTNKIVGWIHILIRLLLIEKPIAEIGGMVVDQELRQRGIGRKLIAESEIWVAKRGFRRLLVRSNIQRQGVHTFYPKLGYKLVKTQKNYAKDFS